MPIVVSGQLLVSLVFAELGSHYPVAGALFHWRKNLAGRGCGWWVGCIYDWPLIITVASVDTGFVIYAPPVLHNLFGSNIDAAHPNTILFFTLMLAKILILTGISRPKGERINFDWLTLAVVVFICLIGAIYFFLAHPHRRPPEVTMTGAEAPSESAPA